MKKLAVYPYDLYFTPLLRHKRFLDSYEITAVVSPNGWGMTGKDAGFADNAGNLDIKITNNFEEALNNCDSVLFTESERALEFKKLIYPKMMMAMEHKKEVINTVHTEIELYKDIQDKFAKSNVAFTDFAFHLRNNMLEDHSIKKERLKKIETPVIFVMGTGERTHKFEIQLALREHFLNMNYKLSQVGSRSCCELLGFHSFPEFMYESSLPESKKVVLFNCFIHEIEISEKPDIIIIGVPGGTMPYSDRFTNRFGILAFEISQAITPDSVVYSSVFDNYNESYFDMLSRTSKYKFGFEIDCFNFSNIIFDWTESKQTETLQYISVDMRFVNDRLTSLYNTVKPIYNIFNEHDAINMSNCLIDRLSDYGKVESV